MKIVKFHQDLVPLILDGSKTSTWRLFDDKDLSLGDNFQLLEFGTTEPFANAVITKVVEKTFAELTDQDKLGHESFSTEEEMYLTYSKYYNTAVGPDTKLKLIQFKLQ